MTPLEQVLFDIGERLAAPELDLKEQVMARLRDLPRLLRPQVRTHQDSCHDCPLPHQVGER